MPTTTRRPGPLARFVAALSAALLALVLVPGAARAALTAEPPVSFGSSPVLDEAGVLGSDFDEVEAAVRSAADRSNRQLFVTYVSTFEDPSDAGQWAVETAELNGMGTEDYLLAVAVDGRQYRLDAAAGASLDAEAIERISLEVVEPYLQREDWAGAAIAAADAIAEGGVPTAGGSGSAWLWIVVVVLIAAAIVVVVLVVRRRRKGTGESGASRPSLDDLRRTAGSALVRSDDAVRASEEELGFAIAAYGEAAAEPYRAAIAAAKQHLAAAFALQQRLDDHERDTDEERRAWYGEILAHTDAADEALEAQAESFRRLRSLESDLPAELSRIDRELGQADAAIAPAEAAYERLAATYAPSALTGIAQNVSQARDRLSFGRSTLVEAADASRAGRTGDAALGVRAAEEAGDQTQVLARAVATTAEDLAKIDATLAAGIQAVAADAATARALGGPELLAAAERTEAELAELRTALQAAGRDPAALAARLHAVDAQIDQVVTARRSADEAAVRAAQQIQQALADAQARVRQAEQFIGSYRGGVGSEARTRLATASAQLGQALSLQTSDPAGAVAAAQAASQSAESALSQANADVNGGGWGGGYGPGPGGRSGGGGDLLGAVLGGIIGGTIARESGRAHVWTPDTSASRTP
ncbi:TPM domain-containing protein, partial [Agromyces seonyuensis]